MKIKDKLVYVRENSTEQLDGLLGTGWNIKEIQSFTAGTGQSGRCYVWLQKIIDEPADIA